MGIASVVLGAPDGTSKTITAGFSVGASLGPSASTWLPAGSPTDYLSPFATVSTTSDAITALKAAPDGSTVVMAAGSYGLLTIPTMPARKTPVVLCGAPHQPVTFNGITTATGSVALARLTLTDTLRFSPGADNAQVAAIRRINCGVVLGGCRNVHVIGDIRDQPWTTNGDNWHVNGGTTNVAPSGLLIEQFWWGPLIRPSGGTGHVDFIQADTLTDGRPGDGLTLRCGYSDNATGGANGFQFKADQQPTGVPWGTVNFDRIWSIGGDGQGNATSQSGPTTATGCVFERRLLVNGPLTMNGCTLFSGAKFNPTFNSLGDASGSFPNNTYGNPAGLTRPVFDPNLLDALGLV